MIFTSSAFPQFLLIVLVLVLLTLSRLRLNNLILLIASYVFYSWLEWRFLFILMASSLLDYSVSLLMVRYSARKKELLLLSVLGNLLPLAFFKYANFFISSIQLTLGMIGLEFSSINLNLILPVGISFYTFQSLSYTIDVYRGKIIPTRNIIDYLLYVSFFPQLVAGPIERAKNLLFQIQRLRSPILKDISEGGKLILFGFFKKVVLADNIAATVDMIYMNPANFSSLDIMTGTWLFAFQIYFDFSAYSDIARGIARVIGFNLIINFRQPYLSRSISEFWRRWHISLSTFFRDYVFIPLGGSRGSSLVLYRNIIIVFGLSGLWHGANWNFIIWGIYHGFCYIVEDIFIKLLSKTMTNCPELIKTIFCWLLTLGFIMTGWIFFRAQSFSDIGIIFSKFITYREWSLKSATVFDNNWVLLCVTIFFLIGEAIYVNLMLKISTRPIIRLHSSLKLLVFASMIMSIFWLGNAKTVEFIYFQF